MIEFQTTKFEQLSRNDLAVWRRFARYAATYYHPFLTPEFVSCIAQSRDDIRIGIVRDSKVPIAFVPYQGSQPGIGKPVGHEISDGQALLTENYGRLSHWVRKLDLVRLDFDHLIGEVPHEFIYRTSPCYQVDLESGFGDYKSKLNERSSIARQLESKLRKLERKHKSVTLFWHEPDNELLQTLLKWKANDLDRRAFSHPYRESWCIDALGNALALDNNDCKGILSGLCLDGEPAALHLGLRSRDCLVSWIPATNPDFAKDSVGSILTYELIKLCSQRQINLFELGRGENQTKIRLANRKMQMAIGSICANRLSQFCLASFDKAKQLAKPLLNRISNIVGGNNA